jgi:hypothetical protein
MGVDFNEIRRKTATVFICSSPIRRGARGSADATMCCPSLSPISARRWPSTGAIRGKAKLARFFAVSEEFKTLWHQRNDVRGVENQLKLFTHPELGDFTLQQMYWYSAPRNGSRLLVYLPVDEAGAGDGMAGGAENNFCDFQGISGLLSGRLFIAIKRPTC